jgi:outer membrane protein
MSNRIVIACGIVTSAVLGLTETSAQDAISSSPQWRIAMGARISVRPEFPGSDSMEVLAMPAMDISYGRWFLNGDGLGAHLVRSESWSLSASLAADFLRRDESDAEHLRGIGDVDRTGIALLKSGYRVGAWQATLALATDVANEGHGTVAELSVSRMSQLTERLSLHGGASGRWIDDEHAETFFGVNTEQSLRSDLSEYDAQSGMSEVRVFLRAIYAIDRRWIVSSGAGGARLQGDAADSPIVEDDFSWAFDTSVVYRF